MSPNDVDPGDNVGTEGDLGKRRAGRAAPAGEAVADAGEADADAALLFIGVIERHGVMGPGIELKRRGSGEASGLWLGNARIGDAQSMGSSSRPPLYLGGEGEAKSDRGSNAGTTSGLTALEFMSPRGDGVSRKSPDCPMDAGTRRPGVEADRSCRAGAEAGAFFATSAAASGASSKGRAFSFPWNTVDVGFAEQSSMLCGAGSGAGKGSNGVNAERSPELLASAGVPSMTCGDGNGDNGTDEPPGSFGTRSSSGASGRSGESVMAPSGISERPTGSPSPIAGKASGSLCASSFPGPSGSRSTVFTAATLRAEP
mmetsp:Transcript_22304/g.49363  ORF Transcript_22304/g.49363 Transcript_22304/m.49363 type:complete len:314 (-) Transcript_22304:1545-2486(-)